MDGKWVRAKTGGKHWQREGVHRGVHVGGVTARAESEKKSPAFNQPPFRVNLSGLGKRAQIDVSRIKRAHTYNKKLRLL